MARLHEYQGKALLARQGIAIPKGRVVATVGDARQAAADLGGNVVVKMQAWVTGRASRGGVRFVGSPDEAAQAASDMLGCKVGGFTVDRVLVEETLVVERELYASVTVSDRAGAPLIMFASTGGTGVEEIAREHPEQVTSAVIDVVRGYQDYQARNTVRRVGIGGRLQRDVAGVLVRLYDVARLWEARSVEVNPLVVTDGGQVVAADCRVTVDDYAVFRHQELGITFARELDRPPTELERIAYAVEEGDYRGTFYFIQMIEEFERGEGVVGFHGAGGGGSMMSMDAVINAGFRIANFVDTSGNPPASKVYRAARIILSQGPIDGYFGSGSGVASQEQFHSARGLAKAFLEEPLPVPAVIRLGGNAEDRAVEILQQAASHLVAPVEGYKKDDTPQFCAERLAALVAEYRRPTHVAPARSTGEAQVPYTFETVTGGTVTYDHAVCTRCESKVCVRQCVPQILRLDHRGCPVLSISRDEAKSGRCSECLACDVSCFFEGAGGGHVKLPIAGLAGYRRGVSASISQGKGHGHPG